MAFVLAVLAAASNALATVLQRIGVEEVRSARDGVRHFLMVSLFKRPIWFAGLLLMTASFLLQAVALSLGSLTTVQPIMVTEIVFLVVIFGVWFHWPLGWREWYGALGTACGLGAFLACSASTPGVDRPTRSDWTLLLIACVGACVLTFAAAHRGSRSWRAACYGVTTGIAFALTAAFIKTAADQWPNGIGYLFTHFETYGVAISGFAGLVLAQHALEAGPVAASQSAMLIVNPLASIVMGIWLFGDKVQASGPRILAEVVSLVVMSLGLTVLSRSPLVATGQSEDDRPRAHQFVDSTRVAR